MSESLTFGIVTLANAGKPLTIKTMLGKIKPVNEIACTLPAIISNDCVLYIESNNQIIVLEKIHRTTCHRPKLSFYQCNKQLEFSWGKLKINLHTINGIAIKLEQSNYLKLNANGKLTCLPNAFYLQSTHNPLRYISPIIRINPGEPHGISSYTQPPNTNHW